MKKAGRILLLVGLASLVVGVVSGCARKSPARSETKPPASEGAAQGAGVVTFAPARPPGGPVQPARPPQPGALNSLRGHDRLLAMGGGADLYPADYTIGALQPAADPSAGGAEVRAVVVAFFDSLTQGKLDETLIVPRWRDELVRDTSYPIADKELPEQVRVGEVAVDGDSAHARILMMANKGRAPGEIYLERSDGRWLVSDLQADFSQLLVPSVRPESFDPAEWKPLGQE